MFDSVVSPGNFSAVSQEEDEYQLNRLHLFLIAAFCMYLMPNFIFYS